MTKKREMTPEQREKARERQRRYQSKPEVIAKRKEYYQRPEVKQRYVERHKTEEHKEYMRQWRASQKGKELMKEAGLRQRAFTLDLWNDLRTLQQNRCAICERPLSDNPRLVHADHCHNTKRPRGLLCHNCNHAEGHIGKTGLTPAEFAKRLEHYLSSPPAEVTNLA